MFFSPFQQRVISWAATGVAVAVLVALAVGVVAAGAKFLAAFGTVIWPIVIASLLALLLRPVCDFLEARLRLPRAAAIAALDRLPGDTVFLRDLAQGLVGRTA